ncbi:MAG: isopentenyl phosphate kinase [bacterium]|nr:isopentenyl phosphate kinase [bacterium]
MSNLIVVKIGGSVITEKASRRPVLKTRVLKQIAKELRTYLRMKKIPLILIHGVGSFAHPLAKRYALHKTAKTGKNMLGSARTRSAVQRLQTEVSDIFIKAGLPVFSLSASSLAVQSKGKIRYFNVAPVMTLLKNNYIPLLAGDVAADVESEVSILSGDQITSFLSNNLLARRVIFLSDVRGVYSDDPKQNPKARLLSTILKTKVKGLSLRKQTSKQNTPDVTGLMQGKLLEVSRISAPVVVCSGLQKGNLLQALEGKNPGTLIS